MCTKKRDRVCITACMSVIFTYMCGKIRRLILLTTTAPVLCCSVMQCVAVCCSPLQVVYIQDLRWRLPCCPLSELTGAKREPQDPLTHQNPQILRAVHVYEYMYIIIYIYIYIQIHIFAKREHQDIYIYIYIVSISIFKDSIVTNLGRARYLSISTSISISISTSISTSISIFGLYCHEYGACPQYEYEYLYLYLYLHLYLYRIYIYLWRDSTVTNLGCARNIISISIPISISMSTSISASYLYPYLHRIFISKDSTVTNLGRARNIYIYSYSYSYILSTSVSTSILYLWLRTLLSRTWGVPAKVVTSHSSEIWRMQWFTVSATCVYVRVGVEVGVCERECLSLPATCVCDTDGEPETKRVSLFRDSLFLFLFSKTLFGSRHRERNKEYLSETLWQGHTHTCMTIQVLYIHTLVCAQKKESLSETPWQKLTHTCMSEKETGIPFYFWGFETLFSLRHSVHNKKFRSETFCVRKRVRNRHFFKKRFSLFFDAKWKAKSLCQKISHKDTNIHLYEQNRSRHYFFFPVFRDFFFPTQVFFIFRHRVRNKECLWETLTRTHTHTCMSEKETDILFWLLLLETLFLIQRQEQRQKQI